VQQALKPVTLEHSQAAPSSPPASHVFVLSLHVSSSAQGSVPDWQPSVAWHVSVPSQNWLLLHAALFGSCVHESVASLQESVVQATVSAQFTAVPATHPAVALHVSTPLQYWPSLHDALFGVCVQVSLDSLQASTVQGKLSAQFTAVPGLQPKPT